MEEDIPTLDLRILLTSINQIRVQDQRQLTLLENKPPGARVIISDYFHSLLGLTCVFSPFFACQGECHLLLPGSGSSRGTSVINYLGCLSGHHLDNSSAKILRSFFFHFLKTIIHFLSASLLLGVILGAIQWVLFHRKFFSLIA